MNVPRVFLPQEPRQRDKESGEWRPLFDLSPAVRFGTIEILLPHGPVLMDSAALIAGLNERLKDYTDDDFIMCIGDPSAIAASVLVAGMKTGGRISLLKYDRNEKQYNVVRLNCSTERSHKQ